MSKLIYCTRKKLKVRATENNVEPAKYDGIYLAICKKCPDWNLCSDLGINAKYRRNGDFVICLDDMQINSFKKNHDISEGHRWTVLHKSVVPKYAHKKMIGGKPCLVITV